MPAADAADSPAELLAAALAFAAAEGDGETFAALRELTPDEFAELLAAGGDAGGEEPQPPAGG